MATLQDIIDNNLYIHYGNIATSELAKDAELCKKIQQILADNNYYRFAVDGIYGPITREALRDFKEERGITGGDVLGPTTAKHLLFIKRSPGKNHDFSTKQGTIRAIISECRSQGLSLTTQIAYVLATVEHETANTFQPVKEAFNRSEEWRSRNLWYYPYYGRGYVQLTHRSNYELYSNILGIDLVNNPEKVREQNIALFILVDGMLKGRFTGKRLGQYVNVNKTDFVNARRVVNWIDMADLIARYANKWLTRVSSFEFNESTLEFNEPALESIAEPEMSEELSLSLMRVMSS